MQLPAILDPIIEFVLSPIFLFALAMVIVVIVARRVTGSKSQSGVPVLKQMRRMVSEVDREKEMIEPAVQSRQDIITKKFNSQIQAIGLEPGTDSGYVPVSHTPLARFLIERGVHENTVSAILAGLMEEESEAQVRAIIDAAADTPDVDLTGEELAKAQGLAVIEWTNLRRSREA